MRDPGLAIDILQQINGAAKTILARFQPISSVEDFTHSDSGKEKLDAICMQLIAIAIIISISMPRPFLTYAEQKLNH